MGATITLLPYLLLTNVNSAADVSILLASITLFVAGGLKTRVAGGRWYINATEFLVLGVLAVAAGYLVGIAVGGPRLTLRRRESVSSWKERIGLFLAWFWARLVLVMALTVCFLARKPQKH